MRIHGFVESVSSYQVRGWVYSPDDVDVVLKVDVEVEGQDSLQQDAGLYRADLAKSGIGSGNHAFVIDFSAPLAEHQIRNVRVLACAPDGARLELSRLSPVVSSNEETKISLDVVLNPVDTHPAPVFVLGAARSGTSAIAQALLNTGCYLGQGEGHTLVLLSDLLATVRKYYQDNGEESQKERATTLARIPDVFFLASIRGMFVSLYSQLFGRKNWLDKTPTPELVRLSPILKELWPHSKFIFMRRRGIENIVSRRRKFPQVSFAAHCADWAEVMRSWLLVKDVLGASAMEIDHRALVTDPRGSAERVAALLGLERESKVLLEQAIATDKPERTAERFGTIYDFDGLAWSDAEKAEFRKLCGEMMDRFDYTYDESYSVAKT